MIKRNAVQSIAKRIAASRPVGITMMMLLYPATLYADSISLRSGATYEGVIANKQDLYYLAPPVPVEYQDHELAILTRDGTMYRFAVREISHLVVRDAYGRHVIDFLANEDDRSPRMQGIAFATIGFLTMGLGVSQKFGTAEPAGGYAGTDSFAPPEPAWNLMNAALIAGGALSLVYGLRLLAEPESRDDGEGRPPTEHEPQHVYSLGATRDGHGMLASYSRRF